MTSLCEPVSTNQTNCITPYCIYFPTKIYLENKDISFFFSSYGWAGFGVGLKQELSPSMMRGLGESKLGPGAADGTEQRSMSVWILASWVS